MHETQLILVPDSMRFRERKSGFLNSYMGRCEANQDIRSWPLSDMSQSL